MIVKMGVAPRRKITSGFFHDSGAGWLYEPFVPGVICVFPTPLTSDFYTSCSIAKLSSTDSSGLLV